MNKIACIPMIDMVYIIYGSRLIVYGSCDINCVEKTFQMCNIVDESICLFFALVFTLSVHHYHPFAPKCKLNRLILNDLSIMHCITIRVLLYEWLLSRECDLREDNAFVQNKNPRKMYVIRYLCTKLKC